MLVYLQLSIGYYCLCNITLQGSLDITTPVYAVYANRWLNHPRLPRTGIRANSGSRYCGFGFCQFTLHEILVWCCFWYVVFDKSEETVTLCKEVNIINEHQSFSDFFDWSISVFADCCFILLAIRFDVKFFSFW